MSAISKKLGSFLWWSYPRGSVEYDVMVGIILAFIFLTPRQFFRDQPRRSLNADISITVQLRLPPPPVPLANS